ncbi:MAG: YbjQ family protein [Myxococcales bacterium]|nr:YbjQ family protein [Myxococcales bacterium]
MEPWIEPAIRLGFPLALLAVTYFIGSTVERRHQHNLRQRELRSRNLPALTFATPPADWRIEDSALVTGSVVISIDYFKRFLAGLRGLFGGRIASYESLLDRARREALLRLKESAFEGGYRAVVNVRLETSRLASSTRRGEGTSGVEVLAFGTALKLPRV